MIRLTTLINMLTDRYNNRHTQEDWYRVNRTVLVAGSPLNNGEIVGSFKKEGDAQLAIAANQTLPDTVQYLTQFQLFIVETAVSNLHNAVFRIFQEYDDSNHFPVDTETAGYYEKAFSQFHHAGLSVEEIDAEHTRVVVSYLKSSYGYFTNEELSTLYHGFQDATARLRSNPEANCQPLTRGEK